MTTNTIRWEQDADGIVTLILDDPTQSANTMTDAYRDSMGAAVDRLYAEKDSITGVIVTSAKKTFFAGGDLNLLIQVNDDNLAEFAAGLAKIKGDLRRLETLGKPVVAAINGAALGGGLEIALATHHRVVLKGAKVGLPEVKLGLLPGGGGVTRVVRLLGIFDALMKVLTTGAEFPAEKAVEIGLAHEVAEDADDLIAKAKAWIKANPEAAQPWDTKGYKIPGGSPTSPSVASMLPAIPGNLRKQLKGQNMPAPLNIASAAVEGAGLDFDSALVVEGRYFLDLARGQVSKNMIQAFWFDLNSINAGGSRPAGFDPKPIKKVGVIGAGMMGAGIAYVSVQAGIDVVLKDVSVEAAEKGKAYSAALLDKQIARGRKTEADKEAFLAKITATADYADLAGVDFVIEAVFENPDLKHSVFKDLEPVVLPDALLGSNTSTLPITGLAEAVTRPEDFIGLHFFSPVDKMPLLEIIKGEQTSDETLYRALDVAKQIKKTPIVVNDSRGFFTSRVIGTFINEGISFLLEGVPAASIEQASAQAGYPAPVLQLMDELNMELARKIRKATKEAVEAAGQEWVEHPAFQVVDTMLEEGRAGKLAGAGFYDYEDGKRTGLWPGLKEKFPPVADPSTIDLTELEERMLFAEALETVKCRDEGVIESVADANIGSIFGIGFPGWTGGVLQYINQYGDPASNPETGGPAAFVARARELAAKHGPRFEPPASLVELAERGETYSDVATPVGV
jgi:3-hydroxyacyl-CoA dehydrogenase/enoyl-CoA hydratase/3-hydroxybutyryl-CoA epimerase